MAEVEGYVTVYESSDGGTGDPAKTFWQFFVANAGVSTAVRTDNHLIAETMRLAITTSSKVRVTFNDAAGNVMSQARIEFKYLCEERKVQGCDPPNSLPKAICDTIRFSPCKPSEIPTDDKN